MNFQNGLSCGGAYIKLLTSADDLHLVKGVDNVFLHVTIVTVV